MKRPRNKIAPTREANSEQIHVIDRDEPLPEYDFTNSRPNKYAAELKRGSATITLDPDVAAAFPDAAAVNTLLRAVASAMGRLKSTRRTPRA